MKTFERLFWPDMEVEGNATIALWLGYAACAWNAFTHIFDVVILWGVINNLRASVAKLPPLNFDEFLSGNTLALAELGLFAGALSLLAILIISKPVWGFAASLVWTCFNVAFYIAFFTLSHLSFVTFSVPILRLWLAIQGLRGIRNYRAQVESEAKTPTTEKPKVLPDIAPPIEAMQKIASGREIIGSFFGGSPAVIILQLGIASIIAGVVLSFFGFDPASLYDAILRLWDWISSLGLEAIKKALRYLVLGAIIIVPLWLLSRALSFFGSRRQKG